MTDFYDSEQDDDSLGPIDWEFSTDVPISDTDIDPVRIGGAYLTPDEDMFVDVYVTPGSTIDPDDISLDNLEMLLGLVDEDTLNFRGMLSDLPTDFDPDAETIRGPFPDEDAIIDWLNETGLWGIASWYYDDETDQYYIDLDYA